MLRIYDTAIELLKLLRPVFDKIAERDRDLADQGRRAGTSVVLNIAEGAGLRGGNRRQRYCTALGSALDVAGCSMSRRRRATRRRPSRCVRYWLTSSAC